MKLMLFALTGMGNEIVEKAAQSSAIQDMLVVTRKENGPFPYYDCQQLDALCRRSGVPYHYAHEYDSATALTRSVAQFAPDIIATCTFHMILPEALIRHAKTAAINFHPSLLPHYRGPTPTHWAIIHGESHAGVTIHRLTSKVDNGEVLLQQKIRLINQTDGELRQELYQLAGRMFVDLVDGLSNQALTAAPMPKGGSIYPGINSKAGRTLLHSGNFLRKNLERGLTPYPGHIILEKDNHDL